MSAVLVMGDSGSGKTTSLRNLDPKKTLVIQIVDKALPFKSKLKTVVETDPQNIVDFLARTHTKGYEIVIVDDFQYVMAFEFMARAKEIGYTKFTDIARNAFDVIMAAKKSKSRVYILAHTEEKANGAIKMKTIGKMLDEKITPEGLFTIVLKTTVEDGVHYFSTQTDNDTVKTPMGMFKDKLVPNDLAEIDKVITKYYE